ncbi:hypothetical protein [Paucihalobacter sp.]|uniref:hypothetical protein n=1 Tax=Paucihalobacter sp. TaxID=2850405 RepID=UPI002FE16B83
MNKVLLILILFIGFTLFGQNVKIQNGIAYTTNKNKLQARPNYYACNNDNQTFKIGRAEIKFIEENILSIENKYNSGLSRFNLRIEIDNNLNIKESSYYTWYDYVDGSETTYEIKKIKLILNKNPFEEHNLNDFKGKFILKIKMTYKPGELMSAYGTKSKTEYFKFKGFFECQ